MVYHATSLTGQSINNKPLNSQTETAFITFCVCNLWLLRKNQHLSVICAENKHFSTYNKMLPVLFRVLRTYAPYITLPFAAAVGIIGYNLENILSDKYTPYQDSIAQKRKERMLSGEIVADGSLKEKSFVPSTIFDKNLSPSLQESNNN